MTGEKEIEIDEIAKSFYSKMKGLMFRQRPKRILFIFDKEDIHPIHSIFVFFTFDAVYLNEDMKIVEIFKNIKPFTLIIRPTKKAKYLLEMEKGSVKNFKLHKKDRIKTR